MAVDPGRPFLKLDTIRVIVLSDELYHGFTGIKGLKVSKVAIFARNVAHFIGPVELIRE